METETQIRKGLYGVVADVTAISKVMPDTNTLTYRGYPAPELCEHGTFEEVAYLLWYGALPDAAQLEKFTRMERSRRALQPAQLTFLQSASTEANPMDVLRGAVAYLGAEEDIGFAEDEERQRNHASELLAKIPTLVAADHRRRDGLAPVAPRDDLGFSENFLYMLRGEDPTPELVRAFDASMILYAEHSFNASTFTARVIASTLSDLNSAITGAIGALKGPLHGGANEAVMHMLRAIESPAEAAAWVHDALDQKKKIMGFGHRVYSRGDSRVPTMRKYLQELADWKGDTKLLAIMDAVERVMVEEKEIHPNLDFVAGPAYYLMDIEIDFYTPLFVMSRVAGWAAHYFEQIADNRLIRPLAEYQGAPQRSVVPLAERAA